MTTGHMFFSRGFSKWQNSIAQMDRLWTVANSVSRRSETLVSVSIPQRKYQQTMTSTMVAERWGELDFVHAEYGSL